MARMPKPWWWKKRKSWYVTIAGVRYDLGPDHKAAFQRFHELMTRPTQKEVASDSVTAIIDAFLDWTEKHRALRTYEWYKQRLQWFIEFIPDLTVGRLRPFHLQQWVDSHSNWSDGMKRGCLIAVQRPFRWAMKQGYIERNPVAYIEKPQAGTRELVISPDDLDSMFQYIRDQEFQDLVTSAWETGARPQELVRVAARHVNLRYSRWVFPKGEGKVKKRPRIVYLGGKALEITQRLMLKRPEGPLFRNTRGRPWHPYAVNCRFNNLKKKLGTKYCLYAVWSKN